MMTFSPIAASKFLMRLHSTVQYLVDNAGAPQAFCELRSKKTMTYPEEH